MSKLTSALIIAAVAVFFVLLLLFVGFRGVFCDQADAVRAVEDEGYTDVVVAARHVAFVSWRSCSGSDAAQFDVDAVRHGRRVRLHVCAGWPAKAVTIRH